MALFKNWTVVVIDVLLGSFDCYEWRFSLSYIKSLYPQVPHWAWNCQVKFLERCLAHSGCSINLDYFIQLRYANVTDNSYRNLSVSLLEHWHRSDILRFRLLQFCRLHVPHWQNATFCAVAPICFCRLLWSWFLIIPRVFWSVGF